MALGRLQRLVYARHGRELMGCKSPVGEPTSYEVMMATTSQRQGRHREVGSEGSPRQNCEPTDRKALRGRVPGTSQHQMTKSFGSGDTVKGPAVQREFTFLSGETCLTGGPSATGAGLRTTWKRVDEPPDPTAMAEEAREVGLRPIAKAVDEPPNPTASVSATQSNLHRDGTGVSRGHSSRMPPVTRRTW